MDLVIKEHESDIEQARRRAPVGEIPGQEIPYFLHNEPTRYRKSPDHIALTRALILLAIVGIVIVIAGSHFRWSF